MLLDIPTSVAITDTIKFVPKECYANCVRTILQVRELSKATYVEGWQCNPVPHEHAWIEMDSKIVDPTAVAICRVLNRAGLPLADRLRQR
jgi:hypothetical protein